MPHGSPERTPSAGLINHPSAAVPCAERAARTMPAGHADEWPFTPEQPGSLIEVDGCGARGGRRGAQPQADSCSASQMSRGGSWGSPHRGPGARRAGGQLPRTLPAPAPGLWPRTAAALAPITWTSITVTRRLHSRGPAIRPAPRRRQYLIIASLPLPRVFANVIHGHIVSSSAERRGGGPSACQPLSAQPAQLRAAGPSAPPEPPAPPALGLDTGPPSRPRAQVGIGAHVSQGNWPTDSERAC